MNRGKLILPLMFACMLLSCSKKENDVLQVVSPLPNGIVPANQAIVIRFSKGIVKQDSTNQWTNTSYIEFSPEIPGKFTWQDTLTLVFSPDGPFPGDTKFKGKFNTALLTHLAGVHSFKGSDEFTFATESFYLKNAEFFYDRMGRSRTVGIRANLEFTYAVNPAEIAKHIQLSIDQERRSGVNTVSTQNNKVIPLELGAVTQMEREKTISITFDNQLVSTETNTTIRMDRPFVFKLPGLEEVKIYGHDFGYDGVTSWITIKTSQEIDSSVARSFITIDPVRGYSLEGNRESLTLRGKFEPGSAFHLTIKKGLESVLGAKTQNDYDADIVIGNVNPSFRFTSSSGIYMLLDGQKHIELKTVNLSQLNVRISQIFQNNLVFFLDGGRSYDYDFYDDYYDEGGIRSYTRKFRYYIGNYGRMLKNDTITIKNLTNQEVTTLYDLNPYLNTGYKGFYLVDIADLKEPWRSTSKFISISDLGLIVKQSSNEVYVFVTSLASNTPVGNVTVNLISTNNQTISSLKTNNDGVARFGDFRELSKDFSLKLVTAETEGDYNFINLADNRVETSRFDVAGKRSGEYYDEESSLKQKYITRMLKKLPVRVQKADLPYDAFMYGDRNIYRPGEKIYFSGVVRDLTNDIPAQMPVHIKIFNPRGIVAKELQHTLNEEGSFESSYQTLMTGQTGVYRFELYTGNNVYLASYEVSVEDFVPDRLKLSLKPSKDKARPGEQITYDLLALNFFGPPAAGRNWEFEGMLEPTPYWSKRFPSFNFTDRGATNYSGTPSVNTGKTDAEGKASIDFAIPANLTSSGLIRARGRVAVFDESGRPVYQIAQTTIYPKDYYIGIHNLGDYYVSPNTPQKLRLIAVDASDKPIAGFKALVQLIRLEWYSVLRQYTPTNTLRYVSEQREIIEKNDVVTLDSIPVEYAYWASQSGEYIVRVSKSEGAGYNQINFYSYSWGTTDVTSFEIDPEARIQMVFDDSVYTPGQKAKILFKTPFDGKMLVTVERNRIFSYRYLDVTNNSASMELGVDEKFLPNVYVSAVLFRKIKDMNIPLLAGHGFCPLMVEKKSNKLDVTIQAPEKIRPKRKQAVTVTVKNEKNVFVTIAAVDEGICQLKNYKTPDPYGFFYAKKALETETFDFFKYLLPEPLRSSTGGGETEMMAKRVNPLGVQRFKPVALWSGILKTDANGRAEILFDIPEFSGELRLMALAYKGDRFGSSQKAMKVADPVVITPALPRFLAPHDSLSMPITAFNTTEKPVSLKFEIETVGGVIPLTTTAVLDVNPNQERFVTVQLKTTDRIGKAVVKIKTVAFGEPLESSTELPVRPIAPFVSEAISGSIEGGATASSTIENIYLPYNRKSYITFSPFPVANFARELKYLVGYPHGCIEQTVSKAFPQIYLRDIAGMLDPTILNTGSPTYFVNEAITKLASMQLHDGAFSYWPGESSPAGGWSIVYATHFLLEAKKAGYAVSENSINMALNAVTAIARSKLTEDYYYYGPGQKILVKRIADKSTIYALYVLALGGQPEKSIMNFYRVERGLLTTDTQYLLAGAFAYAGDRKTYLELLPPEYISEEAQRTSGYNFDSPVRANALILNILLETDLNNPYIPRYMEYLSKVYRNYYWFSTQDDAFTLLAFGKAARMASATKIDGFVKVGEKTFSYTGGNQKVDIEPFGKKLTLTMNGTGRVYYSIITDGIRKNGTIKTEDKNLQVRREFFDRNGMPVNLSAVKQNDLVIVKLTLNSAVNMLENVAITDLLPAGFEIENPRLTENTNYKFISNASVPSYIDIRDDRINLYTSFHGGNRQQIFYYMVRAVTAGAFEYAPVVAEAMYDANYYSASGQTKLRIMR